MNGIRWTRRNIILTIIALLVIGFIGVITATNIRMVQSETNTDFIGSGFRFGEHVVDLRDTLYLYVEGDDLFARNLESSLTEILEAEGVEVAATEELMEKYDNQTLAVIVTEKELAYNPFTPRAEVEIFYGYFSNGNTSYFDLLFQNEPIAIGDSEPGLIQEGRISLSDRTRGFTSYRAYIELIASSAAKSIFDHLPEE